MRYKTVTIIGTSHIAKESIAEITSSIEQQLPAIVAVELDKHRLISLLKEQRTRHSLASIRHIGVKGYLFAIIGGYVQKKLGKIVGVVPGSDMLAAVKAAKKHKLQLALIDQDISITLRKFSHAFTWKEKWHFVVDIVKGVLFKKQELKRIGISHLDLTKVPSSVLIKKLLGVMKQRYPSIYKVLVFERNHVMARNLHTLMTNHPEKSIVAVVGAGHEEDMIAILKKLDQRQVEYV